MPKLGKKDLFTPTLPVHRPAAVAAPMADKDGGEVEKVMVMLSPHQVHALDRICLEIRQQTGMKVRRSMLIRSMIDGCLKAPIDFSEARTPAAICQLISNAFRV